MKQTKLILLALGLFAAMSLTSCLDDDDNNQSTGLTQAEISQCVSAIQGSYSGKMLYMAKNPDNAADNVDTLNISWSIGADTAIVIRNFPPEVLKDYVTDKELMDALLDADDAPMKAYVSFYKASPVSFLIAPMTVEYKVYYHGGIRKASLVFWVSNYSFGSYMASTNVFEMQLVAAGLYLDDEKNNNYINNSYPDAISLPFIITNANI